MPPIFSYIYEFQHCRNPENEAITLEDLGLI